MINHDSFSHQYEILLHNYGDVFSHAICLIVKYFIKSLLKSGQPLILLEFLLTKTMQEVGTTHCLFLQGAVN